MTKETAHDKPTPWRHPACLPDEHLLAQCEVTRGRAGGPGGQHRNKVETLVRLRHLTSGIESHAGERRSQMENKAVALRRMRLSLAINLREPVPTGPIGSALWKSRLREGRIQCNPDHHDYPALLAEALDTLAAALWDPSTAALRLECTTSQLIKLIKDHPPALAHVNTARADNGLHTLK